MYFSNLCLFYALFNGGILPCSAAVVANSAIFYSSRRREQGRNGKFRDSNLCNLAAIFEAFARSSACGRARLPVDVANPTYPRYRSSSFPSSRIPQGRSFSALPAGLTVSAFEKASRPAPKLPLNGKRWKSSLSSPPQAFVPSPRACPTNNCTRPRRFSGVWKERLVRFPATLILRCPATEAPECQKPFVGALLAASVKGRRASVVAGGLGGFYQRSHSVGAVAVVGECVERHRWGFI